jgi:hypothetical protein
MSTPIGAAGTARLYKSLLGTADASGNVSFDFGPIPAGVVWTGSVQALPAATKGSPTGQWTVWRGGRPAASWEGLGLVRNFQAMDGDDVTVTGMELDPGQQVTLTWIGYITGTANALWTQPEICTSALDTVFVEPGDVPLQQVLQGVGIAGGAQVAGVGPLGPNTSSTFLAAPGVPWYLWSLSMQLCATDTTTTGTHEFTAAIETTAPVKLMLGAVQTPGVSGTGSAAPVMAWSQDFWGAQMPAAAGLQLVVSPYNGSTGLASCTAVYST